MKTSVVYFSRGGNTKKVAEVIASVFGTEAADIKKITGAPEFDLLVIGTGTYGGRPGKGVLEFLDRMPSMKGKKAAVFGTSGEGTFEGSTALVQIKDALEKKGAKVTGTFCCRGGSFLFFSRGHPDAGELEGAKKFAEKFKR